MRIDVIVGVSGRNFRLDSWFSGYVSSVGGLCMNAYVRGLTVLGTALIFLGSAGPGDAAVLKAKYSLQGSLASDVAGAPALTDLGMGNRFVLEAVDGVERQVLAFPRGGGLSLATAGLVDPSAHSVVMTFRLAERGGYRRLLDFTQGMSDNGFYTFFGRPVLYVDGHLAASQFPVIGSSYVQVALTSRAVPGGLHETVYVNGMPAASGTAPKGFGLSSGTLRFFKDNVSGGAGGEESAGSVACILVYDGTMSPDEIREGAADPDLCLAPRAEGPQVSISGKPKARLKGRSITVDTGLRATCPIGTTSCEASGRVAIAPTSEHGTGKRLGSAEFVVRPGESRRVVMPLSARGADALRKAGRLKVEASVEITSATGETADAGRTGVIAMPRRPAFKTGTYTGTTSQGLPIFVTVARSRIVAVFFRWRAMCADGLVHTGATLLGPGKRVRRGRFVLARTLRNGGSARVSGRIAGVRTAGTLSRRGATAFKTKCAVRGVTWRAQVVPIETSR